MKSTTTLLLLITTLFTTPLNAQLSKAYLTLGGNLTDDYLTESGTKQVGTRLGINIGAGVSLPILQRWETNLELLYTQNGFYTQPSQLPNIALNKIKLHYLEVPLNLAYRFNLKKNEQAHFYKQSISGGIGYARLFKHKVLAVDGSDVTDEVQFNQVNALLFNLGGTSHLNQRLALNGKVTLTTFGEWTLAMRLLFYL